MNRLLLLNKEKYPDEFNKIKTLPAGEKSRVQYAEHKVLEAINHYNPKLHVNGIMYDAIENYFPFFKRGKTNGAIARIVSIANDEIEKYKLQGYIIIQRNNKTIACALDEYVFISGIEATARNAFVSQIVFPALLDYAEDYIDKPNYSIANHRFCFINCLEEAQTAKMILRNMASLYKMGMDYIEVFSNSIDLQSMPLDLKLFLQMYDSNFEQNYIVNDDSYDGDFYQIHFQERTFTLKTDKMISELKPGAKGIEFNGSSEKFYWMEVLPISIYAYEQGYLVDYSSYELFIEKYSKKFSKTSDKFRRCKTLLYYIKKWCK